MYSFNDAARIGGLTPGVVLATGTTEHGRAVALATAEGNFWYPEEWVGKYRNTAEHDAIRSGVSAELDRKVYATDLLPKGRRLLVTGAPKRQHSLQVA